MEKVEDSRRKDQDSCLLPRWITKGNESRSKIMF